MPTFIKYFAVGDIFLESLDMFSLPVPPELPVAMTVGVIFALRKLKKSSINCINPSRINVAGQVSTVVLDKTGTLTQETISVSKWEVYDGKSFLPPVRPQNNKVPVDPEIWFDKKKYQKYKHNHNLKYTEWMASSHSITMYKDAPIGDILEIEMFRTSEWIMVEWENPKYSQNSHWGNMLIPKEARDLNPNLVDEDDQSSFTLSQIHKFDFSSDLQRMSVIAKPNFDNSYIWYTKGAPEQILKIWRPETLPEDFNEVLMNNTSKGKRVIALSYKYLPDFNEKDVDTVEREDIESDLIFLGFLVMSNNIKPNTKQSIVELKEGRVKPIMATGDNILTAVSVAFRWDILSKEAYYSWELNNRGEIAFIRRDGKISWEKSNRTVKQVSEEELDESSPLLLSEDENSERLSFGINWFRDIMQNQSSNIELVTTGPIFHHIIETVEKEGLINDYPAKEVYNYLMKNCKVYARMSPQQKAILIQGLQDNTGEMIGMWGDGANDWNALKAADIGLSLSASEASIAAPFTSSIDDISSLVSLLRIGRASLDLSYLILKYMLVYSSMEFTSVVILYFHTSNISDSQLLFIDFFWATPVTIFLWNLGEKSRLEPRFPPSSLLSPSILFSLWGQMFLMGVSILSMFLTLRGQGFFEANVKGSEIEEGISAFSLLIYYRKSRSNDNICFYSPSIYFSGICISFFHQIYGISKEFIHTNIIYICR